jgi:AraC-like DNA-binding protein
MAPLEETRPDGHGRARGLVSSRTSGARVEAKTFAPSVSLRDVVQMHWMSRWSLDGEPPHDVAMLGDPCVHLVLEAGHSRIVGVNTRLFHRRLTGAGLIRAVKLRAGAARAVVDGAIVDLNDRTVPLGKQQLRDVERLALADSDDGAAFLHVEQWLLEWLQERQPLDDKIELATALVDHIASHPELMTVAALVKQSGLSVRPPQRLFRDYVGVSPKWILRRHRLQEAALQLERGAHVGLADLAAALGYSDHAHLTRDFKMATGRTPSTFVRDVSA